MIVKIFWCYFAFISTFNIAFGQDCRIDIKNNLVSKAPVFIRNGKLQSPTGQFLTWRLGEESNLLCSGARNVFLNENINEKVIRCTRTNVLTINGRQVNPNQLQCNSISTGAVRTRPNGGCLLGAGNILEIGFNTQNGFVKYIEVCYNLNKASVLYTSHIIPGKAIDYSISGSERPDFSVRGMPRHVRPNTSYRKDKQLPRFTTLLGSRPAGRYINRNSFLARGHLSPDKDGIFRGWQYATYMFINVAPQWQSINSQNWIRVENLARKKASLLNDDLEIVTGISGVLSLRNDRSQRVPITLEPNGNIPVPEYFWKILKYKNSAIAFVTSNNPFVPSRPPCTNICNRYNWPTNGFDVVRRGLTFCCSTSDLVQTFSGDVPLYLATNNILTF